MAFNLSSAEVKVYFDANVAISVSLFTVLVIPMTLLCLLCIWALMFAREINPKIRFLLVNIFATEVCYWLGYTVFYLGWPVRMLYNVDSLCQVFISFNFTSAELKFTGGTIYAISVLIFIKHGNKKIKWYVIISYVTISWILAVAFGMIPYFNDLGVTTVNGFCMANSQSVSYYFNLTVRVSTAFLSMSVQIICIILVLIFMKKNVLEGNTSVKKAIVKVLGYLAVSSVLYFINAILPIFNPFIFKEIILNNTLTTLVAVQYALRLFFNIPALAIPVAAIALLKPVRDSIKSISKKCATCKCLNYIRTIKITSPAEQQTIEIISPAEQQTIEITSPAEQQTIEITSSAEQPTVCKGSLT